MQRRRDSRFTNEQIVIVKNNYEKLALKYNTKLNLIKSVISTKSMLKRAINYKVKDEIFWNVYTFKIEIPYKNSILQFSSSETKYPHISYSFNKKSAIDFYIWQEDFMDKFSKLFGTKELQTGNKTFDSKYFIKNSNELIMKKVLDSKTINYLKDSEISLVKLEDSKLEISGRINELDYKEMTKLFEFSMHIIGSIQK